MVQPYAQLIQQMLLDFQHQRPEDAERLAQSILRMNSRELVALQILGLCMAMQGRASEAVIPFKKAAQLDKKNPELLSNLARAQHGANLFSDALETYHKLLRLVPDSAQIQTDRGTAFAKLKRYEEAARCFERAIALQPDYFLAWSNQGNLLSELRITEQAVQSYQRALQIHPDYPETWTNLGNALFDLGRYADAVECHEKALALNPNYGEAWSNHGNALLEMKEDERAFDSYVKAFQIKPDVPFLYGQLLSAKLGACIWEKNEPNTEQILTKISAGEKACVPFVLLSTGATLEQQFECAKAFIADRIMNISSHPSVIRTKVPGEKIRIGYFSSDFRNHPVGILMQNLLRAHDHSAFEFYGYFLNRKTQDALEKSITNLFDHAYDLFGSTDYEAQNLIAQHHLDIAIDLNGHTSGARTALFSRRIAPIQVNYLGYAGTSGADFFDYLIADEMAIPPEHQRYYSERIVYLPHSFFPIDTSITNLGPPPTRLSQGLPEKGFIFTCFNNAYKIQPAIFALWMDLLQSVEGSVLWLSRPSEKAIANLKTAAARLGVDPTRIIFADRVPARADHLSRIRLADLFLDTPNYNAHATCADALWAGVPVLTQLGHTFAGRVAASQLHALGMGEMIAKSSDEYQKIALDLAGNAEKLTKLRAHILEQRNASPLFDSKGYVRDLEKVYQHLLPRLDH